MNRIQVARQREAVACEAMAAVVVKYDIRWADRPSWPYPVEDLGALPVGWLPLFARLVRRLIRLGWDRHLSVAKEKSGLLVVVLGDEDSQPMKTAIDRAARDSTRTCGVCGSPGELRQVPRIAARCGRHAPAEAPKVYMEHAGARTIFLRKPAPRRS